MIDLILDAIKEAGIKVEETETLKGSCMVPGLSIGEGNIRPTIYENSIKNMDSTELMWFVFEIMDSTPEIAMSIAMVNSFTSPIY